jgi:glucose/arabinose dehydrogenase
MNPKPAAAVATLSAAPLALAVPAFAQPDDQAESVATADAVVSARKIAEGLDTPWAMAFLPDGRMLVTEKPGDLVIVAADGSVSAPLAGTPAVWAEGQGGLMDVALHPDFASNAMVYLTFAEAGEGGTAGTALGRGRLAGERIEDFEVIWRQQPKIEGPNHFGNRIVFAPDGTLFLALGERFQFGPAQDPANTLGTVVRLNADGSIPDDNPLVGREGADGAIWSWGHRNIEAAAIDPETGTLWVAEMGPLGGDELNRIERGANYGWPVVSRGLNYDGTDIPDPEQYPEYAGAAKYWSPVRSPSGMIVYTGAMFPAWRGDILFGALSAGGIERVDMEGGEVAGSEFIPLGTRIREVEQGPDGAIWLLTNAEGGGPGALWRLEPLEVKPDSADGARSGAEARRP